MRRFVKLGYVVCSVVLAVIFLFMLGTFRLDIRQRENSAGYITLKNCRTEEIQDSGARLGQLLRCTFVLDRQNITDETLVFQAYHQNVTVRIDGETVYRMQADQGNSFGSTPGCVWNFIAIQSEDRGRTVEVDLEPVYRSSMDIIPEFFLGSKYEICRDKILKDLPSLILGVIAVILGLVYAAFILYNRKNTEVDKSLLMLGLFSIQIGLWKIADVDAIHILFPRSIAVSYLPYFSLMLL